MRGVILILFVLLIGSLVGNYYLFNHGQMNSLGTARATRDQQYPLMSARAINPKYPNYLIVNFLPLRQQIHKVVDPYNDSFELYFEYLPTGTTIGINQDDEFTAESILKIPVVMAYFHKKEIEGIKADPTVEIKQNELNSQFGDLYKKGAGYKINLADAVKLAVQKSDNTASLVISDQISQDDFQFVYDGLDIPEMVKGKTPIITTEEYTSVLKALYFGGVLTNDDAEYILQLMTQADYKELLPSGVPANIPVAHKFGLVKDQIYQDCGIVYYPTRPYTLCMVSRSDEKTAKSRMHTVSKMVYEYVDSLEKPDMQGR